MSGAILGSSGGGRDIAVVTTTATTTTTATFWATASVIVALSGAAAATAIAWLRRVSNAIGVAAPTARMVQEENPTVRCALLRHLPHLAGRLAWRSLGATPTPIHTCCCANPAVKPTKTATTTADCGSENENNNTTQTTRPKLRFYVKREDLIHPIYGGNKVRTLQHSLAICQVKRDDDTIAAYRQLVAIGTGGSNQVVAMAVHAQALGWKNTGTTDSTDSTTTINSTHKRPATSTGTAIDTTAQIHACWYDADEPDLDNTLNLLSVLSMSNVGWTYDWGTPFQWGRCTLQALWQAWTQHTCIPFMLGGNCPAGVLGQVSGILELAEQIQAGTCPADLERIYVPVGSACTISGLIVGTVLVQTLWKDKNQDCSSSENDNTASTTSSSPPLHDIKIIGCNVHHDVALLDRWCNFHLNPWLSLVPLTIQHSVRSTCRTLHALGGPDILQPCLEFMKHSVELRSRPSVVGKYGGHSPASRQAAQWYDAHGRVEDYVTQKEAPPLWVCGHFVAKALQPLLEDLQHYAQEANRRNPNSDLDDPKYLLWMTKSAVQPRGTVNEWERLLQQNKTVQDWANRGQAESVHRPGRLSTQNGRPEEYRHLMTPIADLVEKVKTS